MRLRYGITWLESPTTTNWKSTHLRTGMSIYYYQCHFNILHVHEVGREQGVPTIEEYLLSRSTYYPGVPTIQEYLLSRSTYYPGVCTIQEYLLSRSTYYPGVPTIQEYLLSRSMYYPGVCTIQEYVLQHMDKLLCLTRGKYRTCTYDTLYIQTSTV